MKLITGPDKIGRDFEGVFQSRGVDHHMGIGDVASMAGNQNPSFIRPGLAAAKERGHKSQDGNENQRQPNELLLCPHTPFPPDIIYIKSIYLLVKGCGNISF
jgi:hypothetical protein